ncbi:hypothetical protein PV682_33400 [Streptomyces niveiscabiei]|nr:hypothetical protein [Streptomyces niveiscabiei]MDX3386316.1 hypothetical protein [Streptomyces niveiscabiei]
MEGGAEQATDLGGAALIAPSSRAETVMNRAGANAARNWSSWASV